jgi:hypothetical protein
LAANNARALSEYDYDNGYSFDIRRNLCCSSAPAPRKTEQTSARLVMPFSVIGKEKLPDATRSWPCRGWYRCGLMLLFNA